MAILLFAEGRVPESPDFGDLRVRGVGKYYLTCFFSFNGKGRVSARAADDLAAGPLAPSPPSEVRCSVATWWT